MGIPRSFSTIRRLQEQASERTVIDYQATRRAFARQEILRQYADWVSVGAAGAPGWQNGWGQYAPGAAWEGYLGEARSPVGFFRDRWGQVHLRGMVQNATLNNAVMFTLPEELWPDQNAYGRSYYITEGTGPFAGVYFRYACLIIVTTSGDVAVPANGYYQTATYNGAKMVTLDGMHFEAANKGAPQA